MKKETKKWGDFSVSFFKSFLQRPEKIAGGLGIWQAEDLYWEIKRMSTGETVMAAHPKEKAAEAARRLADIADWDSGEVSLSNIKARAEFKAVKSALGAERKFNGLYMLTEDENGRVSYTLRTSKGESKVKGKPAAPGLCLRDDKNRGWAIDHVPTGFMLTTLSALDKAEKVAEAIKDIFCWETAEAPGMIEKSPQIQKHLSSVREAVEAGKPAPLQPMELDFEILMMQIPKLHANLDRFRSAMKKLNAMTGLEELKRDIHKKMEALKGQIRLEKEKGIKFDPPNLHMAFSGPAGTGKTEVARIMGDILFSLGYLRHAKVKEVNAKDLIAGYVGQTAPLVKKAVAEAMGGVLFIDEAYGLAQGSLSGERGDFGQDAVNELLTQLENNRGKFVCIVAGYETGIDRLLSSNAGLESRFPSRFRFRDYTPKELAAIAKKMVEAQKLGCGRAMGEIESAVEAQSANGAVQGNARWARNFAEKLREAHSQRAGRRDTKPEDIGVISKEDVLAAVELKAREDIDGLERVKQKALEKLRALVGMDELKSEMEKLMSVFEVQRKRAEEGILAPKPSMHMVFSGPPGTGKTTVASIVGQILKGVGALSNGHFKAIDAGDLAGGGQTTADQAVKSHFAEAMGGVLFIDEAYGLCDTPRGKEAMNAVIREMEERRRDMVVIFAGYEDQMKRLDELNPGFDSRVPNRFKFPHYKPEEILRVARACLDERKASLDARALAALERSIEGYAAENGGVVKDNARWARNFAEKIMEEQAHRVNASGSHALDVSEADVKEAIAKMRGMAGMSREERADELEKIKQEALDKLRGMVGLSDLKNQVERFMKGISASKKKREAGIRTEKAMMHMVFSGPPGTGKTTVAKVIGEFLKGAGVLARGHLVETDGGGMTGQYLGETDKLVKAKLEEAQGGVLFIDEAYAMAEVRDYGKEAVNALIKGMEDKRDDLVVILAGYEEKMERLMGMNEGFESRVKYKFKFPAYSAREICLIVEGIVEKNHGLALGADAEAKLFEMVEAYAKENPEPLANGNGRWARTFVERAVEAQNARIDDEKLTEKEDLRTVVFADLKEALRYM